MRTLGHDFESYQWAPSTAAVAELAGIDPVNVIRFDANVRAQPLPSSRPGTIAGALSEINTYPHGGYTELVAAIAGYNGVPPANVVLGAGADDLIMLVARSFAGPGDTIAIASHPTYPLYRIAAGAAGATAVTRKDPGTDVVLTFCCRPNNPTGSLDELPDVRPLVVDEAYFEYAGETAAGLIDTGVIVLRTFSKAFGLAGARVGYALADAATASELNRRQSPAPVATLSAELAVAALANPPDVASEIEERERLALKLRSIGLEAMPSRTNFIFVRHDESRPLAEKLMVRGLMVRPVQDGIRISVRDRLDDDLLVDAIAQILDGSPASTRYLGRRSRLVRATAETTIRVRLDLDGPAIVRVQTGAGLYDHLMEQLAFHAGLNLTIEGTGDIETGVHHTAEDTALAFGHALDEALRDRRAIARYGDAVVPMDDALATVAIDLAGRPFAKLEVEPDAGLVEHVLRSFANSARMCLHVTAHGRDPHHVAEAAFKAVGRALRTAGAQLESGIPSTKGLL
jgi:histidinol-phosphate/aromatic aminotransferase/cobyric acid decarboxylase-like protein/imidazoleglycerol phosphate dehydratase HisB